MLIKPVKDADLSKDESQYAAVLQHMEHLASSSPKAEIKGRAVNVAHTMKDINFVVFCHFLANMFQILSKMSIHFQRNDLILPNALAIIRETTENINRLSKRPVPGGKMESILASLGKQAEDSPQFQGISQAVDLCLKGLEERFGPLLQNKSSDKTANVDQVISDFLVFNHDAWPSNMQDLVNFGQAAVDQLVDWFRTPLTSSGCVVAAIPSQWLSMKVLLHTQFREKAYSHLWTILLTKAPYKDDLKDVLYLVKILLILPLSAAQCERAISAQNRIKNCHRASLASHTTEDLIRISAGGPPLPGLCRQKKLNGHFLRVKFIVNRPASSKVVVVQMTFRSEGLR